MGAAFGAIVGGGLSYLGAKKQADATEANAQRSYEADLAAQEYYKQQVEPGVNYARAAFQSGVPQEYTPYQFAAADYAGGLGDYYARRATPEFERGRRLEDLGTSQAVQRAEITPQQYAQEQVGLSNYYYNPYQQAVTNQGVAAIQADYDQRARQQAASQIRGGQLASSLAGQQNAALESARAGAIGDFEARQRAAAYNDALNRAATGQTAAYNLAGQAGTQVYNIGQAAANRGVGFGDRAVSAGEDAARLGLGAAYAPASQYLGVVQSPTAGTPRISNVPQQSTVSPLTYGLGQGLQTYYDLSKNK